MGRWDKAAQDQGGFTLLEVLATIGLIAFLYSLFAVRTVGIPERRDVRAATARLRDDLRWIQHQALAEGRVWRLIADGDAAYALEPGTMCDPTSFQTSPQTSRRERRLPGRVKLLSSPVEIVYGCWGRRENGAVALTLPVVLTLWADDGTRKSDGTPLGYERSVRVGPVLGRVTLE